ncbi:MAG: DUF2059 domain-containing protein [Candidatus Latescibacteria bacterium]|jgi:uncharacterized protein|nr:DUF2059 domain-containing protein [Candidatus Latescibacterota bacterium]MBT4141351.1 DUF2059 domain-containing protein [Candidatus Latescibacterota bacterium]MBT5829608.1 DUF2059 domain-containing protein [Candidatus Latescibacterota bacterium]
MKKTIVAFAIGFSLFIGSAQAQVAAPPELGSAPNPEHLKLAEKLVTVMELQKTIEQSFNSITKMLPGQASPSAAQKQVIDMIMKELDWKNFKTDYIQLYAEVFTEAEIKGLIKFYESPAGQAFVKKQPELNQKSMMLSQKMMMKIMPKLPGMRR